MKMARKLYRSDPWGSPEKSIMGGINAKDVEREFKSSRSWKDMTPVKRYKHFTLFRKICPNGEIYHECFLNREIDADNAKRGTK